MPHRLIFYLIPIAFMILNPWEVSELSLWLGYGKNLWTNFGFFYRDTAALLPTDNNVACAWLPSLIYFSLFKLLGLMGPVLLHVIVLLWIMHFIYTRTLFTNDWPWPPLERICIYALLFGSAGYFCFRPALLGYLPFVIAFDLIDRKLSAQGIFTKVDWAKLIGLQILWVNTHGTFILLPLMLGWALILRKNFNRSNLFGLAMIFLASLANPWGAKIYPYVFRTSQYGRRLGNTEWASVLSWEYPSQSVLYLAFIAIALYFLARYGFREPRKVDFKSLMTILPLSVLPVFGIRHTVFLFMGLPLFLKNRSILFVPRKHGEVSPRSFQLTPWIVVLLLVASITLGLPPVKAHFQKFLPPKIAAPYDNTALYEMTARIQSFNKPQCPVLNNINTGGFFLFHLPNKILIDGRLTPFTSEALDRYNDFSLGLGLSALMTEFEPCFAVLPKNQIQLIKVLVEKFNFERDLEESDFQLLVR